MLQKNNIAESKNVSFWKTMPRVLESDPVQEGNESDAYNDLIQTHGRFLSRPYVQLLEKSGSFNQCRMLDIGCGSGHAAVALARQFPSMHITAVDASRDMLECARRNAKEAGVASRIHFIHGDALSLPFDDNSFDCTASQYLLHHLQNPSEFFNETHRVTRSPGRILIKDLIRPSKWKLATLTAVTKWALRYTPTQQKMYRESLHAAFTRKEIKAALAQSHLRNAEVSTFRNLELVVHFRKESK